MGAWSFFVSFVNCYQQTLLATFNLIPRHLSFNCAMWGPLINQSQLSIHILTLQSRSFKPLLYICQCNNWYKIWKSTKQGILLFYYDLKCTCLWTFYCVKNVPAWIFWRQVKHIVHEDFSVCSQIREIMFRLPEQKRSKMTQNCGLVTF